MSDTLKGTDKTLTSAESRTQIVNLGPSHPAMHGIIEIRAEIDGETILDSDVEIGYLHRGFAKMAEARKYNQVVPYTDRLNYVSPLINNFGYTMTVEKLLDIECTPRAEVVRMIMSEISRVTDHLTCIAAQAMELGAFTVFLYMIKAREWLYDIIEACTGARVTVSYSRVGGMHSDLNEGFEEAIREYIPKIREVIDEVHRLLDRNRIFVERTKDMSPLTQEEAITYGITGPLLRATGLPLDMRKAQPYFAYNQVEWTVPTGSTGDVYDRYLVRMEEMEQSLRIIEQGLDILPDGPINIDNPAIILPDKKEVYNNIEGLMNHFKLIMDGHGIMPPKGEAYGVVEGANGELGFYIVSDGTDRPWRVRCHPPCFPPMAALSHMIKGHMIADVIPIFGSVNMIGGELDR